MRPCNQSINLLCHSMGNFVLQHALTKINDEMPKRMPRVFDNIFLCAADVDDDVLEKGGSMGSLHQLCNLVTVYHNKGDTALLISDSTKNNPPRLGHGCLALPQMVHNKIHQVDCSAIIRGFTEHSYYLWATVNDDIAFTLDEVPFDDEKRKRKRVANNREWSLY